MSVHAVAWQLIHAAPERVRAIYQDYGHWPELFRGAIRATRLIRENDTVISPGEIRLEELKPHAPIARPIAWVPPGSAWRYASRGVWDPPRVPLSIVRRRIAKFVLSPLKRWAESAAG